MMTDAAERAQLSSSTSAGEEQVAQAPAAPPSDRAPDGLSIENGGPVAAQAHAVADASALQGEERRSTSNTRHPLQPQQHDREPGPSASPFAGSGGDKSQPALASTSSFRADSSSSASAAEQTRHSSAERASDKRRASRASSSSPVRERSGAASTTPGHRRGRSSSSGGVLKRLTSATSGFNLLAQSTSRGGLVRADSNLSDNLSESNESRREEKQRKFKSGVNLNSADYQMQYGVIDEPFSEQATPRELQEEELRRESELAELHQMAAAGGTKAALTRAKLSSIGNPYFPTTQRSAHEVSQDNAAAAMQGRERQERRKSGMPRLSMYDLDQLQAGGQTMVDGTIVPTLSVQQAIHTARQAAADSGDAMPYEIVPDAPVAPAPTSRSRKDSSRDAVSSVSAPNSAKAAKRRTFLSGFVGGPSIGLAKFGRGGKDINSLAEDGHAETSQDVEPSVASAVTKSPATSMSKGRSKDGSDNGTRTPPSTANNARRRRFRDTRELEYVASQLALESAVVSSPESYGPAVESRRASMMGVLAGQNTAPSSNVSQASLPIYGGIAPLAALPMPHASFMSEARDPTLSSGGNSPMSGSPLASGVDLGRFDGPPVRPFTRSVHSSSLPGSPQIPGSDKMTGIPSDMLAGLGDGPYPTLPPRGSEGGEGNSSAMTGDSQYDLTRPNGGRNSLPSSAPRSRVTSSESGAWTQASSGFAFTSTNSSTPTSPSNTTRRSVLQMSLHNPEAETQGLTKTPKTGRTTPLFPSRGPSRNPSLVALADKFKDDSKKSTTALPKLPKESQDFDNDTGKTKTGIFGRFNKSSASINGSKSAGQRAAKTSNATPSSHVPSNSLSTMATSSLSSESATSHYTSAPTSEDVPGTTLSRGGTLIPAQSAGLRKVPSPSMASSSSHDHSALSSDVGGASHNAATSSVTTPDVPSTTSDFPNPQLFAAPATQGLASQLGASLQIPEHDEQRTPSLGTNSGPMSRSSANTISAEEAAAQNGIGVQTSDPAEPVRLVEKQIQTGSSWNLRGAAQQRDTQVSSPQESMYISPPSSPPTYPPPPGRLTRLISRLSSVSSKGSKKSGRAGTMSSDSLVRDDKPASAYSSMFRKPSMPMLSQHGAWTVEPDPSQKGSSTQRRAGNAVNVS